LTFIAVLRESTAGRALEIFLESDCLRFVAEREVRFEAPRLEFAGVRNLTGIVRFESVAQIISRPAVEMVAFKALRI